MTFFTALGLVAGVVALKLLYEASNQYNGPESDHFDGKRFFNPWEVSSKQRNPLKWFLTRVPPVWEKRRHWHDIPDPVVDSEAPIRVTWINHSTVFVQMAGTNILTDPIWSNAAGLYGVIGSQRYIPPALDIEALGKVDLVVISHNHFDHLDLPSLTKLAELYDPTVIVPLGEANRVRKVGISKVVEMDWWQEHQHDAIKVISVPAQHWSRRTAFDNNRSLWSGYWIESADAKLYFAGDTGDGPFVEQIVEKLGNPDISLLPIGAYLPQWFMASAHTSPSDALSIHTRIGAKWSMVVHWGTFPLGDDGQDEPVQELQAILAKQPLENSEVIVPEGGVPYLPLGE